MVGDGEKGPLLTELRRRNVFKVAVAYAIVAWLLVQVTVAVETPLHLPPWMDTFVIVLLGIGFPVALILAWAFELTPEGVKRTGSMTRQAGAVMPDPAAASAAAAQSIAVLPFVDMSPDKDQEYFSDGISEELLNQLSKIKDLHVAGRTSSFYFKGRDEDLRVIGEKLNVAHVLEGSVRKAGNRVRVTAQLIKAADGYHLWSQSYDRELDDIFAIQDEIAHAVSDALSITLGVGNLGVSTRNIEAYDAYLSGLSLFNQLGRENVLRAIEQVEKAVALDPAFIEAISRLANWYYAAATVYVSDRAGELLEKFERTATHAISVAPDSAGALSAKATLELSRYNWLSAEQLFKKALSLAPDDIWANNNYGMFLQTVGRSREAIEYYQTMTRVDPLSVAAAQTLVVGYETAGDLEASQQEIERAQGLPGDPGSFNGPLLVIALTKGDRAMIETAFKKNIAAGDVIPIRNRGLTETMYAHLDDPGGAVAELRHLRQDPAYDNSFVRMVTAFYASCFGDHELALDICRDLRKANSSLIFMIWRPIHQPMRRLPDFKELLRDLGLVEYWRETGKWGEFCRPVGDGDFTCE
jgi:adenylate cyclase